MTKRPRITQADVPPKPPLLGKHATEAEKAARKEHMPGAGARPTQRSHAPGCRERESPESVRTLEGAVNVSIQPTMDTFPELLRLSKWVSSSSSERAFRELKTVGK